MNYIDIFSGCGGLAYGLQQSGWKALFAIEKSPDAFSTLEKNVLCNVKEIWPAWLQYSANDINHICKTNKKELRSYRGSVMLVAGGPPCQGFSSAGKRNESDARNKLVDSYLEFVDLVKPEMIFFENVRGFTMPFTISESEQKCYSDYIVEQLKRRKYRVNYEIINFSDFGVPQSRKRFILFASRKGKTKDFFQFLYDGRETFLKQRDLEQYVSVQDAISDLMCKNGKDVCPDSKGFSSGKYGMARSKYQRYMRKNVMCDMPDSHRFAKHKKETEKRFRKMIFDEECNKNLSKVLLDKYGVKKNCISILDKNLASPTITTHPDDHIHYEEPRILTVREYARLQSFPDDFEFKGKYTTGGKRRKVEVPRYTQVGNAIPPLFAEQVGIALKKYMEKYGIKNDDVKYN